MVHFYGTISMVERSSYLITLCTIAPAVNKIPNERRVRGFHKSMGNVWRNDDYRQSPYKQITVFFFVTTYHISNTFFCFFFLEITTMWWGRYSKGRTDIEHLGPNTKIVWNKAQPPLSKKLHDFCTLMHMEALEDGAFMLITRATEHPQVGQYLYERLTIVLPWFTVC